MGSSAQSSSTGTIGTVTTVSPSIKAGHSPVPGMALPVNDGCRVNGSGAAGSKSAALAGIIRQPSILERIGSAWPLYFRLVLVEGGRMVTDYHRIGEMMGTPQSTIEKWIAALVNGGIVEKRQKGRGIEIALLDPHLSVARMPNQIEPGELPVAEAETDSVTQGVLKIIEGSKLAGGRWTISVTGPNGPT